MSIPLIEHLNAYAGILLVAVGLAVLLLLSRIMVLQQKQLDALEEWEVERRNAAQPQPVQEQVGVQAEQVDREAQIAREQQVQASRQTMAEAMGMLHQLKRQFG